MWKSSARHVFKAGTIVGIVLASGSLALAQKPESESVTKSDPMDPSDPNEEPRAIEEFSLEDLLGTVITASGREQSVVKAPATVTVINSEEIRASGSRSIPDLLRMVAGVQMYEAAAGNYVVSTRGTGGLQANNIVVQLDGDAINGYLDGAVNWATLPVDIADVERIEVVRGPVSTIYGANAYTGVVNIITRSAGETAAYAAAAFGGYSTSGKPMGALTLGLRRPDGPLHWRLGLHANREAEPRETDRQGVHLPLATRIGADLRASVATSPDLTLSGHGGAALADGSQMDHLVLSPKKTRALFATAGMRLDAQHLFASDSSAKVWLHGQWTDHPETTDTTILTFAGAKEWAVKGGAEVRIPLPLECSLTVGADGSLAAVDAPFLNAATAGTLHPAYGVYLLGDLELSLAWSATVGVRNDSSAFADYGISYRGSVNYGAERVAAHVTVAHGFRNPTYVEAAGQFIDQRLGIIVLEGQPSLRPQQIDSVELGFIVAPVAALELRPIVYGERLRGVISENFTPLVVKSYENIDLQRSGLGEFADLFGGELEVRYQLSTLLLVRAALSVLWWPGSLPATSATIGVPDNNSTVVGALGGLGEVLDGRLTYGVSASVASPRSFAVRVGVPPAIVTKEISTTVRLDGTIALRLAESPPLWVRLLAQSHLPHDEVESPLPNAGRLGTSAFLGVEYRGE